MIASDLLEMGIPIGEKVLRTVAVYAAILALLRIAGRRDLAQLSTFDLVVVLLLSNVVQNAVIGPDDSLVGGLLGAVVLIAVNEVWSRGVQANPRLIRLFEGSPVTLAANGRYLQHTLRREGIRPADLDRVLHLQGADGVHEVDRATLDPGGAIVVELRDADQNASRDDLAELRRHLDTALARIEARLPGQGGIST